MRRRGEINVGKAGAAAKSMKVHANPNRAKFRRRAVKTFLIDIPNLCLVTDGEEPSIARRSDLAFIDECGGETVEPIIANLGS